MGLFGFFSTLICCTSFESFRLSLVLESLRENVKGRKQEGKVKKRDKVKENIGTSLFRKRKIEENIARRLI